MERWSYKWPYKSNMESEFLLLKWPKLCTLLDRNYFVGIEVLNIVSWWTEHELCGKPAEILIREAKFLERIQSTLHFGDLEVSKAYLNSNWHSQIQQQYLKIILATLKNNHRDLSFNTAFLCSLIANYMFHLALVFIQVFWFLDLSVQMWIVGLIHSSLIKQKQWREAMLVW